MSRRELIVPARALVEVAPGVRVFVHGDAAVHLTVDTDSPGYRLDPTPPGEPHSGPPPAEGGAPTAH